MGTQIFQLACLTTALYAYCRYQSKINEFPLPRKASFRIIYQRFLLPLFVYHKEDKRIAFIRYITNSQWAIDRIGSGGAGTLFQYKWFGEKFKGEADIGVTFGSGQGRNGRHEHSRVDQKTPLANAPNRKLRY